jgi:hypothetical protein
MEAAMPTETVEKQQANKRNKLVSFEDEVQCILRSATFFLEP